MYPALFRAPDWEPAHTAHRRGITPVVAVVYTALVATSAWVVADGVRGPSSVVALAGVALALGATALAAAPLHGKVARGRDATLLRRLRVADLVRSLGALVALSGALLAVL